MPSTPIPVRRARVLFSYAHPDDESFQGAGMACRYRSEGAEIVLCSATRGERGRRGEPPLCSVEELPARREAELREAARLLGIAHVHILDYEDRQLSAAPPDRIRRQLVTLLRRHRPHVVLTFDPNGFNGHTDHVAISRFTTDAILAAADPRYEPGAGAPWRVPRLIWNAPIGPWDAARDADLATRPGVDFIIDTGAWRDAKAAALRAHATQHLSINRHFFDQPDCERILSVETYRQAWGPPLSRLPSSDVLEGLELD